MALEVSLIYRLHDTAGCQTVCLRTGLTTVLNEQPLFVQPVVKTGCTSQTRFDTLLTTGCIVYTNVWQQVVSCKRGLNQTFINILQQKAVLVQ